MSEPKFNDAEIEAGRLLFARPFVFVKGCVSIADLPDPTASRSPLPAAPMSASRR